MRPSVLVFLLAVPQAGVGAQAHAHDDHGDAASLKLGTVVFPTSATPAAHRQFVRGVALLHNFHYPAAAQAFRDAQTLDPGDVMSYWGEAMTYTHPVWNQQDTAAARAALRRLGATRPARRAKARSPREGEWLAAVEVLYAGDTPKAHRDSLFATAMLSLHASDPKDVEAAAFYTLALLGLNQGVRDVATYERAYLLADSLFAANPDHPGAAHYLIHAVDDPEHARRGLRAARAYANIAPSAGHALHMTSHIFIALGLWDDMVRANERANALRSKRPPGHSTHWLVYGLLQQGRYKAASRWLDSVLVLARTATTASDKRDAWDAAGLIAAAWTVDTRLLRAAPALLRADTSDLGDDRASVLFGIGLGALGRGERLAADSMLRAMVLVRVRDSTELAAAHAIDPLDHVPWGYSRVMEQTLRALMLRADGRSEQALALLRTAAASEDTLPFAFGPPNTIKPPHEAAGELLLELHRPVDAERELNAALKRTPGRPAVLLSLARAASAQRHATDAARRYGELARIWHDADAGIPDVGEARRGGGKGVAAR